MSEILNIVEAIIRDNYQRLTCPVSSRSMMALPQAYALSIVSEKMSYAEIAKMVASIESICDAWADHLEKFFETEGPACAVEWDIMAICQLEQLASPFLSKEKRHRWAKWALAYCDAQMKRPFYYTGYNHELMRCVALNFCGETFHRPEFIERSIFFAKQLLQYLTPLGFWEEGPHHGPSQKYNYFSINGLSWMYRLTGEECFKSAAIKLIVFMSTYVYPDGATVGPIDGRQSSAYSQGMFMTSGLELSQSGQSLFYRHAQAFFNAAKKEDLINLCENYFLITGMMYYKRFKIETPKNYKLPLDQDAIIESHDPFHDAVMQRKGDWVCCVSGHAGQIPKEAPNIYRLERQSRIELWHKDLKFVIGGGHSKTENNPPYVNVMIATDYLNQDFSFGQILSTDKKANHAMYFARAVKTFVKDNIPNVTMYYAHASVTFSIHIESNRIVKIKWQVEQMGAKKIAIQIPIVVPKKAELHVDQKKIDCVYLGHKNLVKGNVVEIRRNQQKLFKITTDNQVGVRYPNLPLVTYIEDESAFFDKPDYYIGILSYQNENPSKNISGSWIIELGCG